MRNLIDLQPTTALALALWVALVPALASQTQRSHGRVVLPVELSRSVEASACSAKAIPCGQSSSRACQAERGAANRAVPVRCCVCICLTDLTMDIAPMLAPLAMQPIDGAWGDAASTATSRTIRPPVPPPKSS